MPDSAMDLGVASCPKPGEKVCGDHHMVATFDKGTLIAVVDALGHGDDAFHAAQVAERALREDPSESVIGLVKRCHAVLRGTRGVVMSLARCEAHSGLLTWIGVGNVEGVLVQTTSGSMPTKANLLHRGGVVGSSLPPLRAEVIDVTNGALLLFATDGVQEAFADNLNPDPRTAQEIADDCLRRYAKDSDDALVLCARLRGHPAS